MSAAARLTAAVERATPKLLALSEASVSEPRAPGEWCPKEIIGHLIDSATNNHGRFVRAQLRDDLLFEGYDGERWVEAQRYSDAVWTELVALWRGLNVHVARVIENAPQDVRDAERARHNLDQIAFRAVPRDQPATLDFFMNDYVDHLEHHLAQIFPRDTMSA
jgi:hypothetical protein